MYSYSSPILTIDDPALELQDENSVDNPSTSNHSQDSSQTSHFQNRPIWQKGLYSLRKEQLQLEAKRVQLLQELIQNIDTANKIQQRRNEILETLFIQRNNREGESGQNN